MRNSWTVNILVVLALVQGIAGLLRAVGWVQIGTDLFGQGVLLLPIVGAIAMARGLIIEASRLSTCSSPWGPCVEKPGPNGFAAPLPRSTFFWSSELLSRELP